MIPAPGLSIKPHLSSSDLLAIKHEQKLSYFKFNDQSAHEPKVNWTFPIKKVGTFDLSMTISVGVPWKLDGRTAVHSFEV